MAAPTSGHLLSPNREVSVVFDHSETIQQEPHFILTRRSEQLAPTSQQNMLRLVSGAYILKPINDIELGHERNDANAGIVRLTNWNAAGHVVETPYQRKFTELTGIAASAVVASTGDHFCQKRIAAGDSWNQTVTPPETAPTLDSANYPLDCVMVTKDTHNYDHGYILRIILPGSDLQNPDWFFGFAFGGELVMEGTASNNGYGRFWLALAGDGRARLYERKNGAWTILRNWRFTPPSQAPNGAIVMRILPHAFNNLEFATFTAGYFDGVGATYTAFKDLRAVMTDSGTKGTENVKVDDRLRILPPVGTVPIGGGTPFGPITGIGRPAVFVRRDLRCRWQVSRIMYPLFDGDEADKGILEDRPFSLPYQMSDDHVLRPSYQVVHHYNQATGAVFGDNSEEIREADGSALTSANETFTFNDTSVTVSGYEPPGGLNKLKFTFKMWNTESTQFYTPVWYGYSIIRNGHQATVALGEKTPDTITNVSMTGPTFHPDHETASFVVEDIEAEHSFLAQRGRAPVRITTTFNAADQTKKAILHEGYLTRARGSWRGAEGRDYPDPEWKGYHCFVAGKWQRLHERWFDNFISFEKDDSVPGINNPTGQAWKVTDVLRWCLHWHGFPESQIDIRDDDQRLFSLTGQTAQILTPAIGSPILPYLIGIARDYLNAYLFFDPNAKKAGGLQGIWRMLNPPVGTETPLAVFVNTSAGSGKARHIAKAHGTEEFSGTAVQKYPILKSYDTYVIPPEGNSITVRGGLHVRLVTGYPVMIKTSLVNRKSFNAPGFTEGDPTDPDWIGYHLPLHFNESSIPTMAAAKFIARRIYDIACRGRKIHEFIAELVLVNAQDSETTEAEGTRLYNDMTFTHRPLRPGDTVYVNSTRCVVMSVNPHFDHSGVMLAHYEVEEYRAGVGFRT